MSINIDRIFNNITKLGYDTCDLTNKNKENIESSNYMLENYNVYNPINSAMNLATNQPLILIQNNHGINGNVIDTNSELQFSSLTQTKERHGYQQRIFNTIPYLGKGQSNIGLESKLMLGDASDTGKKSLNPNSEISYIDYSYMPLLPSIENRVKNPANHVEDAAADGWIRGGVPSRQLNHLEDNS
jgi:hypothetical protein